MNQEDGSAPSVTPNSLLINQHFSTRKRRMEKKKKIVRKKTLL